MSGLTEPCYREEGGVGFLVLENDDNNTLTVETLRKLHEVFSDIEKQSDAGAVLITSAHPEFFIPGAHLEEVASLDVISAVEFSRLGQGLFETFHRLPVPVIAAVDGYCMGGGMDFILACDVVLATPRSVFAHPGAAHGIVTGFGGNWTLPRRTGVDAAKGLFMTCERIGAEQAHELGVVDVIVEEYELVDRSRETARALAAKRDYCSVIKQIRNTSLTESRTLLMEKRCLQLLEG